MNDDVCSFRRCGLYRKAELCSAPAKKCRLAWHEIIPPKSQRSESALRPSWIIHIRPMISNAKTAWQRRQNKKAALARHKIIFPPKSQRSESVLRPSRIIHIRPTISNTKTARQHRQNKKAALARPESISEIGCRWGSMGFYSRMAASPFSAWRLMAL